MNKKELSAYAYESLHFHFHWTIHQDFYFVEQKDGKGKWKPEATKTIIKAQKSELESGKTKYEKSQSHSIILWLILAIIGIIIILIGWMVIQKKKRNSHNQKNHGKV